MTDTSPHVSARRVPTQRGGDARLPRDPLRAVADVNDAVRGGLDRDAVLGLVARKVRNLLGAAACTIMTLEDGDVLLIRSTDGEAVRDLAGTWIRTADTVEGQVVRRQQSVIVPDATDSTHGRVGLPAVLAVPVPGYERPGGLIEVADGPGRRFTPEDARTVGLFAASVGMEIEHDRARTDLERLAITTTPGTMSLQQTLDTLTSGVVAATGALACAVHVIDDDLSLRRASSFDPDHVVDAGMGAAGPSVAQAAIAARTAIVHERVLADEPDGPRQRNGPAASDPPRATALVCVPLLSRGLVLGVLCCHCPAGSPPSKLELAYLTVVAGKAATAVDSSQLVAAAQEKAALEERQRLARELHDSVSQALYGIALGARTALRTLDGDPRQVEAPIGYILALAEAGLADMRALIFELRPQALAEEGLVAALRKQLAALQARHGVATHAELGAEPSGALKVKQTLYRIAQEAMQNIARHAQANRVTIRLTETPAALALEIGDDGIGFDPNASFPGHLGLRSMRERITEIGGVLDLTSSPGQGTQVRARAPTGIWR
ncbi:GAF domain-containing protein [Actinopolymorpha sp. B11F2]|uniref:GAF domain-containing sensor histidine kinase n=1 Tax=Actinopolymorpha sp. B11F2 TaxID=3160862 RepID=UPI0032E3F5E0